jgi:hypothetical protein
MMSCFIRVRQSVKALLLMGAMLCLVSAAAAQQYRTDPIDEAAKRHGAKTQRWIGNAAEFAADKANFTDYFQKYYFPAMTRNSPNDLADLGKLRIDLFKKYLWGTTNAELQSHLTDMAYKAMVKIISNQQAPNYHPAVRYNAILVIGLLDDQYAIESGANPRPPKPHAGAAKVLTKVVELSTTSTRFPPPVVLGALIGLERQTKYHQSLTPEAVKAMSAELLKFVNQDKPIQGMDADAFAWLQLRAASALANLGSLGEKNAVHDSLIKFIAKSKSLDDRCSAAGLLGSFKYENVKLDGSATTDALFKLTSDLSAEELKRAQDYERLGNSGAYAPAFAEPGRGSDSNAPQDPYPRRHLLARLMNLEAGLTAVKPALPAESQKQVDAVLAAIKPVIKAAGDVKATISLRVADTVRSMSQSLAETIGAPQGASDDADNFSAGGPSPGAAPAAAPAAAPPAVGPGTTPPAASETAPADAPAAESPPAAAPAAIAQPEGAKN